MSGSPQVSKFVWMKWIFLADDLTAVEKLVLQVLAHHSSAKGTNVYPTKETVASWASLSVRSIHRAIATLERDGYIEVMRTKERESKNFPNRYIININRLNPDLVDTESKLSDTESLYQSIISPQKPAKSRAYYQKRADDALRAVEYWRGLAEKAERLELDLAKDTSDIPF